MHFGIGFWQWLEEATALPRVGLLDAPDFIGKAEQPRWQNAADKHYPHLPITISNLILFKSKKLGPCRTHFWGPLSFSRKKVFFITCLETDL